LLSGNIEAACDKSLHWLHHFGLYLWYGPPEQTVSSAVAAFESSWQRKIANTPFAPKQDKREHFLDLRYYLLKMQSLFETHEMKKLNSSPTPLHTILDPRNYSDSLLDVELAWHLYTVLLKVGFPASHQLRQFIHTNYASQLLMNRDFAYALFAMLHSETSPPHDKLDETAARIKKILRSLRDMALEDIVMHSDFKEDLEMMGIPKLWLHKALALECAYKGQVKERVRQLIACKTESEESLAHEIIVKNLINDAILNDDKETLSLLATLKGKGIPNWGVLGGVYLEYTELLAKAIDVDETEDFSKLVRLRDDCQNVAEQVAELSDSLPLPVSSLSSATISHMSSKVADILLTIENRLDEQDPSTERAEPMEADSVMIGTQFARMPLTTSARLALVHQLCMNHLRKSQELTMLLE
jgi:hypothetical protein